MAKEDDGKKHPGFLLSFAIGGGAAFAAELFTYPADVTKTRMQLQGERYSGSVAEKKKTSFQMGRAIIQREGFSKLWQGMSASLSRQFAYAGARMAIYGKIRETIQKNSKHPDEFPVWMAVISGGTAGGISQFLASPFDLLKVQMQMDGLKVLRGKQRRFTNVFEGLVKVYSNGGIRTLYQGSVPNGLRGALVNAVDIGGYDSIKRLLHNTFNINNQFAIQCIGGLGAGFFATSVACPVDVVKNRMMNQPVSADGQGKYYQGAFDCVRKTIANEGLFAVYKGFPPMWLRIGPFTIIFWNTLELERYLLGLSEF